MHTCKIKAETKPRAAIRNSKIKSKVTILDKHKDVSDILIETKRR